MYNRSNQRINYFRYLTRSKFQSSASPFFFGYGRTALKAGLISSNISVGKKILVPNYICNEALQPFNELGIGIKYYSVNEDLSPNWDSIKKILSNDVVSILMVHYFGIPQQIDQFIRFSKENNLLLIEDNSHGYGSLYSGKLLGTLGDIGISSPRKSFPILNGGVLFLNNGNKVIGDFPLEPANIQKLIIRDVIGRILDNAVTIKELFLKKPDNEIKSDTNIKDWSIDKTSHNLLIEYNLEKVRELRTNIYKVWEKWCKANDLSPIFLLKDNSFAPLSTPLLFDSKSDRDKWLSIFRKNHIAAYIWPDLPREIMDTINSGKDLRDRTLCFPIHLSMKPDKLEKFLSDKFIY